MALDPGPTPGRLTGRPGVLLCLLFLLPGLATACEAIGGGETLQLDSGEVRLEGGAEIREVWIGGAGALDSIAPSSVSVDPGDVVRFEVTDNRTHALAFAADALDPAARQFLEETQQLRGPPLVNEGAAWVVSLQDAPSGQYPFVCRSHGATGMLRVTGGEAGG